VPRSPAGWRRRNSSGERFCAGASSTTWTPHFGRALGAGWLELAAHSRTPAASRGHSPAHARPRERSASACSARRCVAARGPAARDPSNGDSGRRGREGARRSDQGSRYRAIATACRPAQEGRCGGCSLRSRRAWSAPSRPLRASVLLSGSTIVPGRWLCARRDSNPPTRGLEVGWIIPRRSSTCIAGYR
jgi:hypothetical protein